MTTNENKNVKMEVSGKAIASIPKFVQKKFGKEGYRKWLDAISAEAHNIYILPIEMEQWYPLKETIIEPCANIAQLFYKWDLKQAAWDLGRFSSDFGIKTFYKRFIKVGSTQSFLNKASEFMSAYYRPTTIEALDLTESSGKLRIMKFPELDRTIEYRIAGWTERSMEINGCKNVNVEITKSLTEKYSYTEFLITWG